MCTSNNFSGGADAAGPGPHFENLKHLSDCQPGQRNERCLGSQGRRCPLALRGAGCRTESWFQLRTVTIPAPALPGCPEPAPVCLDSLPLVFAVYVLLLFPTKLTQTFSTQLLLSAFLHPQWTEPPHVLRKCSSH